MKPLSPYHFFLKHAGYSWDPRTETEQQGRIRSARALASAERDARRRGYSFRWSIDPCTLSSDWINGNEDGSRNHNPWQTWQCVLYAENTGTECHILARGAVLASLHGIDFGRDGEPWGDPYRRVVEAELASEALAREGV